MSNDTMPTSFRLSEDDLQVLEMLQTASGETTRQGALEIALEIARIWVGRRTKLTDEERYAVESIDSLTCRLDGYLCDGSGASTGKQCVVKRPADVLFAPSENQADLILLLNSLSDAQYIDFLALFKARYGIRPGDDVLRKFLKVSASLFGVLMDTLYET